MKASTILLTVFLFLFFGCQEGAEDEHGHSHDQAEEEAYSHTLYTDQSELFVEFRPLVVGEVSSFAAHITLLGDKFLPLEEGKVTLSLIIGDQGIKNVADSLSSPGIFMLALNPITAGLGQLIFDIETPNYKDQLIIENVMVYSDRETAINYFHDESNPNELSFLKETAWNVDFANIPVQKRPFRDIIKTNGQLVAAPGDEIIVTASTKGVVLFSGDKTIPGSAVKQGTQLFQISGSNTIDDNIDIAFSEANINFQKTKIELERSEQLVQDQIISESQYLEAKAAFENAKVVFNNISKNYSSNGQTVSSPMGGFVKNVWVSEGQYVEAGTPLAVISKNKKLLLQASVSQKYFHQLPTIVSANFSILGSDLIYDSDNLNGRIISYGKSVSAHSPFIPVTFEIDNIGDLISGSAAQIYLKTSPIPDALMIPCSALIEEQGHFYVYVQTGGESFIKTEVKTGISDGVEIQVLDGVSEGDRVVSTGAYQIKLATASGALPAHSHAH